MLATCTEHKETLVSDMLVAIMSDERLGNLGVLAMQGFSFPLNVEQIYKEFVIKHNRKMCTTSVLYD